MELSEFKKYFRMNFKKKYFLTTKIPGSVLIRGGHLGNVAQLVSMKGEREDVPLQYLFICKSN